MILHKTNIERIELELTGYCNLACPLCLSQNMFFKHIFKKHIRTLIDWINQLNEYKNLKDISLAGFASEPTLYPDLIELIDYIKSRNIKIELYTNGNTHDEKWWRELGKILTNNDKVYFTICGSTQELHEKYRVGSNLQQILNHAAVFRENGKKNDYIKIIRFKYNQNDINNIVKLTKNFSNIQLIDSVPFNERFKINDSDICMTDKLKCFYNYIKTKNGQSEIECRSLHDKFINIDNFGNISPCFLYKLYEKKPFEDLDYSNIVKYKYDFCFECEKYIKQQMQKFGIEQMV